MCPDEAGNNRGSSKSGFTTAYHSPTISLGCSLASIPATAARISTLYVLYPPTLRSSRFVLPLPRHSPLPLHYFCFAPFSSYLDPTTTASYTLHSRVHPPGQCQEVIPKYELELVKLSNIFYRTLIIAILFRLWIVVGIIQSCRSSENSLFRLFFRPLCPSTWRLMIGLGSRFFIYLPPHCRCTLSYRLILLSPSAFPLPLVVLLNW